MDTIVEEAWPMESTQHQRDLIGAITKYREAMKILLKHSEPSDEDINDFRH
jgi:hypothetical protein